MRKDDCGGSRLERARRKSDERERANGNDGEVIITVYQKNGRQQDTAASVWNW